MSDKQAKGRIWLLTLAVSALALVALACGETTPPTTEATAVPEATGTPRPTDTPTMEPIPSPTFELFPSGGLGLSRTEWEQQHTPGDTTLGMVEYDDGRYSVMFTDGKAHYLERVFTDDQPALDQARAEAQTLFPHDSQFLETYSPEGMPELIVDLYSSESLKERFDADVFIGGDPGSFIAIYGVFDGRVPRIVLATGNNP